MANESLTIEESNKINEYNLDPELPSLEEKVDALLDGDPVKISEIKARINTIKEKHNYSNKN